MAQCYPRPGQSTQLPGECEVQDLGQYSTTVHALWYAHVCSKYEPAISVSFCIDYFLHFLILKLCAYMQDIVPYKLGHYGTGYIWVLSIMRNASGNVFKFSQGENSKAHFSMSVGP